MPLHIKAVTNHDPHCVDSQPPTAPQSNAIAINNSISQEKNEASIHLMPTPHTNTCHCKPCEVERQIDLLFHADSPLHEIKCDSSLSSPFALVNLPTIYSFDSAAGITEEWSLIYPGVSGDMEEWRAWRLRMEMVAKWLRDCVDEGRGCV